ncbi:MAG: membrane protein insertase YidC [Candidatus Krumholzibacteriota bacterium]|nr:membrane protein insertase YidC [Candidatus Krumholzibacteriota bacterium]
MERRALLAFAASMILFLAYDALYLSPKNKEARERRQAELALEKQAQRADSLLTAQQPYALAQPQSPTSQPTPGQSPTLVPYDEHGDTTVVEPGPGLAVAGIDVREIVVASDLYEITLTTRGAEVVSARLLNYLTDDEPVELFAQNPGWTFERVLNVTLNGPDTTIPLNSYVFNVYDGGVGDPLSDGARVTVDGRTGKKTLVFRARSADGRTIERSYTFYYGRYDFDARVQFTQAEFPGVTEVSWGTGPGMTATEPNVKDDQSNFRATVSLGEEKHTSKPGDFGNGNVKPYSGTLNWFSIQTKYFTTAIIPAEPMRAAVVVAGNKEGHRVTISATVPAVVAGGRVDQTMRIYMGPLDIDVLKQLDVGLESTVQMGWKFVRPVSSLVLWAMKKLYKVIPNYGWVILIVSVLTKVLFYRLTHKSFKSMKEMQELQPRLTALKEKFKGDQQRVSKETMKLYKEAGVNPLGGCLPMLLQMPVFIALFNVLKFTIEVRGAAWFGWINDLSQPDVLFRLPISLPVVGDAFSLLPLVMGASMVAQSKLGGSPTGGGATQLPAGFQTMMPIVFTFLFYTMPSGLVLYWIVNTVLSVVQQYYIHKEPKKDDDASVDASPARPAKRRLKTKER